MFESFYNAHITSISITPALKLLIAFSGDNNGLSAHQIKPTTAQIGFGYIALVPNVLK